MSIMNSAKELSILLWKEPQQGTSSEIWKYLEELSEEYRNNINKMEDLLKLQLLETATEKEVFHKEKSIKWSQPKKQFKKLLDQIVA